MRIEIRLLDADEGMASDMAQSLNVLSGELGGVMLPYRDAQMLDRLLTARISLERTDEDQFTNVLAAVKEVARHVKDGNKLCAIQDIREWFSVVLKTAKELVDVLWGMKG